MKKRILPKILIIVSSITALIIGSVLLFQFFRYKDEDNTVYKMHTIAYQRYDQPSINPVATTSQAIKELEPAHNLPNQDCYIDMISLKTINPDTMAYIQVPGTVIDYPVVSSDDSEKYAYTDFFGHTSSYGTIYADKATDMDSPNLILYGHHMKSGKMFGNIPKYINPDYRNEHPEIHLVSDDVVRHFTVCAAFKISPTDTDANNALKMTAPEDAALLNDYAQSKGILYSQIEDDASYISLLTCEYSSPSGRFVVMGKEEEIIKR